MTTRSEPSGWATGFTAFAALMMVLIGFFQALMGLAAILNQNLYVTTEDYVFAFDVSTWGWIQLIIGVLVLGAGIGIFSNANWARAVGVIVAVISAVEAFLFIPYQPVWSVVIVALSVGVIWALTTRTGVVHDPSYDPNAMPPEDYS